MTDQLQKILRISLLVALIGWGTFVVFNYLAVPVHQAVMLTDSAKAAVSNACPSGGWFCIGMNALWPSIQYTVTRAQPFLWYVIISALLFAALLGLEFFRSGRWNICFSLTPLKLWLLFLAFLWLLFTLMSNGMNGDQAFRRIFQPSKQVYTNASDETINALLKDYNVLKQRGCLIEVQNASAGIEVSDVSEGCMQQSFLTRVMSEFLLISYFLFVLLSVGRMMLGWLRIHTEHLRTEALFSAGIGACGVIALLWLIALFGIYTQPVGWAAVLFLPILAWRHALRWLKVFVHHRWTYEDVWWGGGLLLGWLLLSYLVLNFLTVVRPFPIGWDDLGVYLNDPRLLVSYGHMIPRMGAFEWEYMTSLGFLLFGYSSYFGATTALLINWTAGLLAVLTVYVIAATYLGRHKGFIAALVYYTLPLVGHFSFADMKVDNAVFTMGALSMFAVFLGLFRPDDEGGDESAESRGGEWKRWIVLAGILAGFGFAMKQTMIMVVMALNTVLFGVLIHAVAYVGVVLLVWALYTEQGVLSVKDLSSHVTGNTTAFSANAILLSSAIVGIAFVALAIYLRPQRTTQAFVTILLFMGTFMLSISPWVIHNNILIGNIVPRLVLNTPNNITPTLGVIKGITVPAPNTRILPDSLILDPSTPACKGGTSKSEELDRYWGYSQGWGHYLGLPWRTVMNADSAGYYVTTVPGLLLFPLLLLLPYFWSKRGRWLRWMFLATTFMIVEWMFLANGIPWYGIGMFLGMAVGLEALVAHAPDKATRIAASIFLFLSFLVAFANRFWQFEQQRNLYDYGFGVISAYGLEERTIPHYGTIRDIVLQRKDTIKDRPYVYRVGTFIPYFIPKNLETIPVADHQLDMFTCLNAEHDPQKTVARMKALGFNSIIFDTNTQTIERDPNGTLHKKVEAFVNFLNTPNIGLQILVNDPNNGIAFILLQ